jgi:hypothetical protein
MGLLVNIRTTHCKVCRTLMMVGRDEIRNSTTVIHGALDPHTFTFTDQELMQSEEKLDKYVHMLLEKELQGVER